MKGICKFDLMVLMFLIIISSIVPSFAQDEFPVSWRISTESAGENASMVKFEAFIDKGWVIYAMESSDDGPIATSFTFEDSKEIKLEGKTSEITKAESKYEPLFETNVLKFSKKAVFAQKVIQVGSSKVIKGKINYMACDGTKCLPPTDVPFLALLN